MENASASKELSESVAPAQSANQDKNTIKPLKCANSAQITALNARIFCSAKSVNHILTKSTESVGSICMTRKMPTRSFNKI
jgi:hypothetical protein